MNAPRTLVFPGSFDPFTIGHLDIVTRALALADHLVIGVGTNRAKTPRYGADERVDMIRAATAHLDGVEVRLMPTTLVDLCREVQATAVVKGLRDANDLTWEATQAAVNRDIAGVETLWLPTRAELAHISSSVVREMQSWRMDYTRYVPAAVAALMGDND